MQIKNVGTMDPRMKIFAIVAAVLVLGGMIYAFSGNGQGGGNSGGTAKLTLSETSYYFGEISMKNGLARHTFTVKNEGSGDLDITSMNTSCMCTTVTLDVDGQKSPVFGMPGHSGGGIGSAFWSQKIKPGQTGAIEVVFDPLAHGPEEVGRIKREINIYSNNGGRPNTETVIRIAGNVTK